MYIIAALQAALAAYEVGHCNNGCLWGQLRVASITVYSKLDSLAIPNVPPKNVFFSNIYDIDLYI